MEYSRYYELKMAATIFYNASCCPAIVSDEQISRVLRILSSITHDEAREIESFMMAAEQQAEDLYRVNYIPNYDTSEDRLSDTMGEAACWSLLLMTWGDALMKGGERIKSQGMDRDDRADIVIEIGRRAHASGTASKMRLNGLFKVMNGVTSSIVLQA